MHLKKCILNHRTYSSINLFYWHLVLFKGFADSFNKCFISRKLANALKSDSMTNRRAQKQNKQYIKL